MTVMASTAVTTGQSPRSAEFLERFTHSMRTGADTDLPHAYFVEEARLRLSGARDRAGDHHHTSAEQFQSSACFDAWARDGEIQ